MKLSSLFILAMTLANADALFGFGNNANSICDSPCVPGEESIMDKKEHGTSHTPVQDDLRWDCDGKVADRICNFNRHYAEFSGYFESTAFLAETAETTSSKPVTFYDSNTGKKLFTAPIGRTWKEFLAESRGHGWPSFRDAEVHWDDVRVLKNGETVSVDGTHLGHNLPDGTGNRYCINLVSVAGNPTERSNRFRNVPREDDEDEDL